MPADPRGERFSRQALLPEIGASGQAKLARARIAVLGCGATGGSAAALLARAGIGFMRLIDRDLVEPSNLPRQLLFTEADTDPPRPKAVAAAAAIAQMDSQIELEPVVADITAANVRAAIAGCDLVIDGGDNFQLRYLTNDACVEAGTPWIYQAAVGMVGQTLTVVPGETACLACWLPEPPATELVERCDTVGVLGTAVTAIAAMAATAALRLLVGGRDPDRGRLFHADAWNAKFGSLAVRRRHDCRACARANFTYLRGEGGGEAVRLCGREAVQISAPGRAPDLAAVAARLSGIRAGAPLQVHSTPHLLSISSLPETLHLFRDGRAIVQGTTDPQRARALLQQLVGM